MKLLQTLSKGDLRTTGAADFVASVLIRIPRQIAGVFAGLYTDDPGVRMRCADALAKVAAKKPELLAPFRRKLLKDISQIDQQEVQWHVAEILGYIELSTSEAKVAGKILEGYFDKSESRIVRVNALQTLVVLSKKHAFLRDAANARLKIARNSGVPSLEARARKLSKQ